MSYIHNTRRKRQKFYSTNSIICDKTRYSIRAGNICSIPCGVCDLLSYRILSSTGESLALTLAMCCIFCWCLLFSPSGELRVLNNLQSAALDLQKHPRHIRQCRMSPIKPHQGQNKLRRLYTTDEEEERNAKKSSMFKASVGMKWLFMFDGPYIVFHG